MRTQQKKSTAKIIFYVIRAMTISRQRVDKHIPAEDNGRNNGSIAMQL
jgi:hypothetical protein